MPCPFPEHHKSAGHGGFSLPALVGLVLAVVAWLKVRHPLAHFADVLLHWALIAVEGLAAAAAVYVAVRLVRGGKIRLPRANYWRRLRNVPRALWAALRWHHLSRNLGLAFPDKHRPGKVRRPRAIVLPGTHGVTARVRTVPGSGRAEFEAAAGHIGDYWRCGRVSVDQQRPGRLIVRGMRHDPLLELLGLEDGPGAGTPDVSRVWLGRDEHGADRWLDLRNVSGVAVGGQPGGGKSQAITSWETQLAPSPAVQFVNCDGKGAGEFDDFTGRAWITGDESMDGMLTTLETLTGLMYDRLRVVRDFTGGKKNIWTVGVSAEWPLIFSIFDETQSWLDLPAAKALGKDAEKACAQAIKLGGELVRKGRSVGMCSVFATQKPTTDSLPSSISSNCALSVAFSLKTLDAAKATLGADIGNYPSLSPVTLSLPEHAGVCVATLRDGMAPFTRLRSPLVTEDQAAAAAAASAHLRRDPRASLPVIVPDDAAELLTT